MIPDFFRDVSYPVCHHSSRLRARGRSLERWWRGAECVWAGGEGGWEGLTDKAGHRCGCAGWGAWHDARCSSAHVAYRRDGGKVWNLLPNWPSSHKDHHWTLAVLYPCQFSNGVGWTDPSDGPPAVTSLWSCRGSFLHCPRYNDLMSLGEWES